MNPIREKIGHAIREPKQWDDDGGARVETVTDPNWLIDGKPRIVRRVGWRTCMTRKHRFFSPDIARVRMCDDCKSLKTDLSGSTSSFCRGKAASRTNDHCSSEGHALTPGEVKGTPWTSAWK